jgi:hypothetical protein
LKEAAGHPMASPRSNARKGGKQAIFNIRIGGETAPLDDLSDHLV